MTPGERRGLVYALRANGATFREIGAELGISAGRAHQILRNVENRILWAVSAHWPQRGNPLGPEHWRVYRPFVWTKAPMGVYYSDYMLTGGKRCGCEVCTPW